MRSYLQVHKNCSYTLASVLRVELIKKVVIVRLILLAHFIVKYLKSFPMLCILQNENTLNCNNKQEIKVSYLVEHRK